MKCLQKLKNNIIYLSIASFNFPFLLGSDVANAGPAFFLDICEILHTFQICWKIFSFLLGGFLTGWEGFINVVHAFNL